MVNAQRAHEDRLTLAEQRREERRQTKASLKRTAPLTPRQAVVEGGRNARLSRRSKPEHTPISPATSAQRAAIAERACIVCAMGGCHPAHLIDRSLAPAAGDDPRAVIPLCPVCHRAYDEGPLDLSPYLEPYWRESVAWAVEAVGLMAALRRITKRRWEPIEVRLS